MRQVWRGLLWIGMAGAAGLLAVGYLGRWSPLADALSIGRLPAAMAVLVLAALLVRPPWLVRGLGGVAALSVLATLAGKLPGPGGGVTVYSKNLLYLNGDAPGLLADIEASGADILLLQEVSGQNRWLLGALSAAYPHQHLCPNRRWNGVAVLSRTPLVAEPLCTERRGAAAARVTVGGAEVWAVSVHLSWPWPYDQAARAAEVAALMAGLEGPVIFGGDMNTVPWAATVRALNRVTGTRPARGRAVTYRLFGVVPLPLDQVHAPGGGRLERRGGFGSDHFGVVARVRL